MEPGRADVKKIMVPKMSATGKRLPIQPTVFRRNRYEMMNSLAPSLGWLAGDVMSPPVPDTCARMTLPVPLVPVERSDTVPDQNQASLPRAPELTEAPFPLLIPGRPQRLFPSWHVS